MRKIQIAGYGIESAELPEDVEALEAQGENLEEAAEALEAFALLLQPAVEGYAVSPAALEAVAAVTNRLVRKAGLPSLSVSTESIVVDTVQQAASLGLEDIKEHISNAFKATVEFLKKLYATVVKKLGQFNDWISSGAKKTFEKLTTYTDANFNTKVDVDVSVFKINGKFGGKLIPALQAAMDVLIKLAETEETERKLNNYFDGLATGRNISGEEHWKNDIDKLAKEIYVKFDSGLKLDKTTHLTTTYIAGRNILGLVYEEGNPRSFAVETQHNPSEIKQMTLRELGVDKTMARELNKVLEDYAALLRSSQEASDASGGNRWDKYKDITKNDFHQDRVRACTQLSAIISRCERIYIDAISSLFLALKSVGKAIDAAGKTNGDKTE